MFVGGYNWLRCWLAHLPFDAVLGCVGAARKLRRVLAADILPPLARILTSLSCKPVKLNLPLPAALLLQQKWSTALHEQQGTANHQQQPRAHA
jgi:hypothetical protein